MKNIPLIIDKHHSKILLSLFLITIFHVCGYHYFSSSFSVDKTYQIEATQSIISGKGYTVPLHALDKPNPEGRRILFEWPPGYSLALLPSIVLSGNVWWSTYLLDCFAYIIIFASLFYFTSRKSPYLTSISMLFLWAYWAFVYNPFMKLTSSDLLALSLLCMSLVFSNKALENQNRTYFFLFIASLFNGLSGLVRFSYWPLLTILPVSYFLFSYSQKVFHGKKMQLKEVAWISFVTGILFILIIGYQKISTGHTTFLEEQSSGKQWFYPNNLLHLKPVLAESMGFHHGWYRVRNILGLSKNWHTPVIWFFTLLCSYCCIMSLFQTYRKYRKSLHTDFYIFIFGSVSILFTLGMLMGLAFLYPPDTWMMGWTYLDDLRYYAPIFPFMAILLFSFAFHKISEKKTKALQLIVQGFLILSFLSVGFWSIKKWWGVIQYGGMDYVREQQLEVNDTKFYEKAMAKRADYHLNNRSSKFPK